MGKADIGLVTGDVPLLTQADMGLIKIPQCSGLLSANLGTPGTLARSMRWWRTLSMPNDETPRQRYRRLAGECLAVAKTMPEGKDRTVVLEMALVWHRLTNEYVGATMLLFDREQPAIQQQQQQQIQPDDGKKE